MKIQVSIYSITPFDAESGTAIQFRWDGNMAFKNRCIIKDNDTYTTVYDHTIDSFESCHPLDLSMFTSPLINGRKYLAYIIVYDRNGIASDIQSTGTLFLCLKTPTFLFSDLPPDNMLTSSTQTLTLSYSQENGELLNEWSITIYSMSRTEVSSSGSKYSLDNLEYTFSGFVNNTDYYIRAEGKTENGMPVDTGYIPVKVRYDANGIFSLLQPVNIAEKGVINLTCNIVSAEGDLIKDGIYIHDTCLDLRDNVLEYNRGFNLMNDFSLAFVFYGARFNQCICKFSAADAQALSGRIFCRIGRFGSMDFKICYELQLKSHGMAITHFSNQIDIPKDHDLIGLLVVRKNSLYHIEIKNIGKADV